MKTSYVVYYTLINEVSKNLFWGSKQVDDKDAFIEDIKKHREGNWVFNKITKIDEIKVKENNYCRNCDGKGYIPKFVQYNGGICYVCKGRI